MRSRLVKQRTALINQIRGLLSEYGIVMARRTTALKKCLPAILDESNNELTPMSRECFIESYEQLKIFNEQIDSVENKIKRVFKENEDCKRISQIAGIGVITATAVISAIGNVHAFKNGRHFAAFLGLVPGQHSSGDHQKLLSITKHGDPYLRTLLIHGARAALRVAYKKDDFLSVWLMKLKLRRGENIACVALANKNARVIWALLAHKDVYTNKLEEAA